MPFDEDDQRAAIGRNVVGAGSTGTGRELPRAKYPGAQACIRRLRDEGVARAVASRGASDGMADIAVIAVGTYGS